MDSNAPEAEAIVNSLRGTILHVPNLLDIFEGWPIKENYHYERITDIVEGAFDRSSSLRAKYRKANYARFVSLYYPHPEWEQVQTLTLYIIWLFCWDDAIDQQGTGDLSNDLLRAKNHRDDTTRVLEHVLGLTRADQDEEPKLSDHSHVNAELKTIGYELKKVYTHEQRQTFMTQVRRYIENCHEEQTMRLHGTLPDIQSYNELRHGTAAVWTLCTLIEYGLTENIPEHIRYMGEIQTLWAETSRGIWITNDILSLKKEIPKDGFTTESIVNAIPILMKEGRSPQEAVDSLLADLAASVASFEAAAAVLKEAAGDEGRKVMEKYCDACRCMVTGSIQFTYESTRYQIAGCLNQDGSLSIML
ncbi:Presilphiperfolan-8-beta-ol synthase [Colletotrichum chlorophyti]|uniref:Terpene synthase n=1 Tax=Colletotrichum chlorophyti TaxID=708187 RepID=A0A1Q8S3B2_9PEZI|nr:Presilphiperfolan-8-beta-ol synthase [Colletotrichum chlorophyti]